MNQYLDAAIKAARAAGALVRENFGGMRILEFRRRRLLPCSLIRSKRLYHSVNLLCEVAIRVLPISKIGSHSRSYFLRQHAQVPLVSEHVAIEVQL